MKVIDLLNKIANGEELPKRISYYSVIYYYENNDYVQDNGFSLFTHDGEYNNNCILNDEIEIIDYINKDNS